MLKTVMAGAALVLGLAAAPAQAGPVLDRVQATKTLTLSSDPAYPPQSFLDENNRMVGFDIDVGREIARRLDAELEIVTPAWEIITAGNWGERWDISVGSMTPTTERARVLEFPAVYYYVPASFAVHAASGVQTIEDLQGKRIGVCGGCTYEAYLNGDLVMDAQGVPPFEYLVQPGEVRIYDTDTNAFDDLRLGDGVRLDAVMSALPTLQEAIRSGMPLRLVGDPVFYEPLAVAVDKGDPEFAAKIAEIVQAMHEDGTLSTLSERWYGVDLTRVRQ